MAERIEVAKLITPIIADTTKFTSGIKRARKSAASLQIGSQAMLDAINAGFKKVVAASNKTTKAVGGINKAVQGLGDASAEMSADMTRGLNTLASKADSSFDALAGIEDATLQVATATESMTAVAVRGFDDSSEAADGFNQEQKKGIKVTTTWADKIKTALVAGAVNLFIDAAKTAIKVVGQLGAGFAKLAVDAAPLKSIGAIFEQNTQRFGVSLDALNKASGGTISNFDLMRQANEALIGVSEELGTQMGEKMPALLEGARAAARATGKDVGFLYESIVNGVKKASPLLIDNTGLVLNLTEANDAMAKELGKTVDALTQDEKSLAILNATTEAAIKLSEQYGVTQLTVAEQLQRASATMQNFKDDVGSSLQPVLSNLLGTFNDLAARVIPNLNAMMSTLAPAFDVIADKLGILGNAAVDAGEDFIGKFGGKMMEGAEKALSWGINVSSQFASGLVKGATDAIVAAMTFIGNLLSSWLAPGSPPKVYPDLDKDGASAFGQYLKGMTSADFGILEGLQAPLQKTLSALVDTGELGKGAARGTFKNLSLEIAAATEQMAKTGKVGGAIFEKLAAAGGEFGDELSDLARKQFALAGATREVAQAEEALSNARKENKAAQENVNKLADEFNELLAAGASSDVLDAKRAEFAEAEKQLALSEEQLAITEDEKKAADEKVGPLQEQANLQQKVLDQILAMTDAQETLAKETEKTMSAFAGAGVAGAGGIGEIPALALTPPTIPAPDFSLVTEQFQTQKEEMSKKFSKMFEPVTKAWEESIQPSLKKLRKAWEKFSGIVKTFYDEKIAPTVKKLKKFLPEDLVEKLGQFAGVVLVVAVALGLVWLATTILLSPLFLLAVGIGVIITFGDDAIKMFTDLAELMGVIVTSKVTSMIKVFQKLHTLIKDKILKVFEDLRKFWFETLGPKITEFLLNVLDPLGVALQAIEDFVKGLTDKFASLFDKLSEAKNVLPDWMTPGSPTPLELGLRGIGEAMDDLANFSLPELSASLGLLPGGADSFAAGEGGDTNSVELNVYTQATTGTYVQDFETARAML